MSASKEGYFLCIIQTNNRFNNQNREFHFSGISKMGNKGISDSAKEIAGKKHFEDILKTKEL